MPFYKVVLETKKGIETRVVESSSQGSAKEISTRKGGKVISIKKTREVKGGTLTRAERFIFMQRLAAMQQSKMGLGESLSLMEATFSGNISRVSGRMQRLIEAGGDCASAISDIGPPNFPLTTVALVKAGAAGGDTAAALKNATEFELEMQRIKKGSSSGIWNGVIGYICAFGIVFGTTRVFGPQVIESDLMALAGDKIDVDWAITLGNVSEWIMGVTGVIALALILLSVVGRFAMASEADKLIMRIPFYKDLVLARNNFMVMYGLSMLIKSGVNIEAALSLTHESAPKGVMKQNLFNACQEHKKGYPWAKSMSNLHATDRAALSSAQNSESVVNSLDAIAAQYKAIYAHRMATLAPLLMGFSMVLIIMGGIVLTGQTVFPMLQLATAGQNLG